MKILFLDIMSVLITQQDLNSKIKNSKIDISYLMFDFSKTCMNNLKTILSTTNANVVITSCNWREDSRLSVIQTNFVSYGINPNLLVGYTPKIKGNNRTEEIKRWITLNKEQIESYAILDEENLIEFKDNLVQTKWQTGLTKTCMDKVIKILNK